MRSALGWAAEGALSLAIWLGCVGPARGHLSVVSVAVGSDFRSEGLCQVMFSKLPLVTLPGPIAGVPWTGSPFQAFPSGGCSWQWQ